MKEKWKEIEGFNGRYLISNTGRIKSLKRKKERILKLQKGVGNYLQVNLSKNGISKPYRVHRLVAKAFIKNTENKPDINHIDGNKHNNCILNLEWCTKSENMQHAVKTGLFIPYNKGKHGKECHSSKKVAMIDKYTNKIIRCFNSQKEGALFLGKIDKSNISSCCKGRSKSAYGYKWKIV